MRTRSVRRLAAALVNLLFLLAWGEPVALHPCPMHDGTAAVASSHHGDMGGHHTMATAAPSHASHEAESTGHVCNCLGQCAVSVGVVPPTPQLVRWQVIVTRRAEPEHADVQAPRTSADRLLPFANGPPASA